MSELRIIRGKDIELKLNGSPLFGVTEFTSTENKVFHEVKEYMSSKVAARVPQQPEYKIKLRAMSMFDPLIPEDGSFTLSLRYEYEEYVYGGCRVLSREKAAKGIGSPESVYSVTAESCIWREAEDE